MNEHHRCDEEARPGEVEQAPASEEEMNDYHKPRNVVVTGEKGKTVKTECARELRQNMTPAERLLWERLRRNQLDGFHFRRQQVIRGFIADFYCHEAGLAVEIDGAGHDQEYDEERDRIFAELGIRVLRFRNHEVLQQTEAVVARISDHLRRP